MTLNVRRNPSRSGSAISRASPMSLRPGARLGPLPSSSCGQLCDHPHPTSLFCFRQMPTGLSVPNETPSKRPCPNPAGVCVAVFVPVVCTPGRCRGACQPPARCQDTPPCSWLHHQGHPAFLAESPHSALLAPHSRPPSQGFKALPPLTPLPAVAGLIVILNVVGYLSYYLDWIVLFVWMVNAAPDQTPPRWTEEWDLNGMRGRDSRCTFQPTLPSVSGRRSRSALPRRIPFVDAASESLHAACLWALIEWGL